MVAHGIAAADRDDAPADGGERLGLASRCIHRRDASIEQNEIGVHAAALSMWSRSRYQPPTMGRNQFGLPL
jgi:hypothetical protein